MDRGGLCVGCVCVWGVCVGVVGCGCVCWVGWGVGWVVCGGGGVRGGVGGCGGGGGMGGGWRVGCGGGGGGHFAGMPMVANRRGVVVKNRGNMTKSGMDGPRAVSTSPMIDLFLDTGMLDQVEQACNEAVKNHIDVLTHVYQAGSEELKAASSRAEALGRPLTRGLPDDHVGAIRVIQIGTENNEIDNNMCCGTHVTNLSQLQMIKLLYSEKSKKKEKSLVYFLVGDRVNQYLSQCFIRERELTGVLNGGPEYHSELAEKSLKNSKKYQKTTQNLLKEIASLKVTELKASKPKFYSVHRQESDMDFCNVLLFEMAVIVFKSSAQTIYALRSCSILLQIYSLLGFY